MFRKIVAALAFVIFAAGLSAAADAKDTYVNGYTRKDGTYVAPHYRSAPNSSTLDNYSTRGNVNPYTGQSGTRDPYRLEAPQTYGSSPTLQVPAPSYTPPAPSNAPQTNPYQYNQPNYGSSYGGSKSGCGGRYASSYC